MKVIKDKKYIFIWTILFVVILIALLYFTMNTFSNQLTTESKEELKSITLQLCDEKGDITRSIVISDSEYMNQIHDYLTSVKTGFSNSKMGNEGDCRLVFTYAYAYDGKSGKQDVVLWGTDNLFYRRENNGYVYGESAKLHNFITNLLGNAELGLVRNGYDLIESITIYEYEGTEIKSSLSILDVETINTIYSYLESIDTKVILYPGEMSEWTLDTEYELILKYENQDIVIIFTGTESVGTFYRYTETFSSNGEEGYVYGKHTALHELIVALMKKQQATVSDSDVSK